MPAFNSEKFIRTSLDSVLSQTHRNFELIVIDDFSTDCTKDILNEYKVVDARIKVIYNSANKGVGFSRNCGVRESKGDFIAFIDSDDIWVEDKLEKSLELISSTNCDVVFSSYRIFSNHIDIGFNFIVPEKIDLEEILKANVIGLSTVVGKRNVFVLNEFSTIWYQEDFQLWVRLLKQNYTFIGLKDVLVFYRNHNGGRSKKYFTVLVDRFRITLIESGVGFTNTLYYTLVHIVRGVKKHLRSYFHGKRRL